MSFIALSVALVTSVPIEAKQVSAHFESTGSDRKSIADLLKTYTRAVSTKNLELFDTLLLSKDIPFSSTNAAIKAAGLESGSRNYISFRQAILAGKPFTQRFKDVRIHQDGVLADVTLVFVNSDVSSSNWGWKAIQLLKVDGRWKIASEFYTLH